jgi:hypothetical protein
LQLSKLEELCFATVKNFRRLRSFAFSFVGEPIDKSIEAGLTYCVIEAHNTWSNFAKCYYISCAFNARTSSRKKISTTISVSNMNDAIGLAITCIYPKQKPNSVGLWHRRQEPIWHEPNTLIRACGNLGCSNHGDVIAAFSSGSYVFNDFPTFRNFYAHRSKETLLAAQRNAPKHGISATFRPSQILIERPLGSPNPLLLTYIDDFIFVTEYLCN